MMNQSEENESVEVTEEETIEYEDNEEFAYQLIDQIPLNSWDIMVKDSDKIFEVMKLLMENMEWKDIAKIAKEATEVMGGFIDDEILTETINHGIDQLEHNCSKKD